MIDKIQIQFLSSGNLTENLIDKIQFLVLFHKAFIGKIEQSFDEKASAWSHKNPCQFMTRKFQLKPSAGSAVDF